MKTILNIMIIAGLSYVVHLYLPFWWLIAIVSFITSFLIGENTWKAFLSGFLGVFILWLVLTGINAYENDFILVTKMTEVLKLPQSSLLFLMTAAIGGLIGGFSSLTGYYMKTIND